MSDPYIAQVTLLIGAESGSIVDETLTPVSLTMDGSTAASATQAYSGTYSAHIPSGGFGFYSSAISSRIGNGTTAFTIECFVYMPGSSTTTQIIGQLPTGGGSVQLWRIAWRPTIPEFEFLIQESGGTQHQLGTTSDAGITYAAWNHIAVDYDGTKYRIYINGTYMAGLTSSYTMSASNSQFSAGGRYDTGGGNIFGVAGDELYLDEIRITNGTARYATNTSFTVPSVPFPRPVDLDVTVAEGLGLAGGFGPGAVFPVVISQGLQTVSVTTAALGLTLREALGVIELCDAIRAKPAAAAAGVGLHAVATPTYGIVLTEGLGLDDALASASKYRLVSSETLGLDADITLAVPVTVGETLGVASQLALAQAIVVVEQLGLLAAPSPLARYQLGMSEVLSLSSSQAAFFGASISETLGTNASLLVVGHRYATLTAGVGVSAVPTPRLIMRVTAAAGLGIDPDLGLKAIFNPVIAEGLELSIGYLAPDGSFTTWVMNTRNAAVTEYDNFVFNSFATMGHKYIAASSSGLYELLGDDDDGDDIVARLKSGLMQFGGTHLSRLKEAYIATRGEEDFILRIITGNDVTYNYVVSSRNMRATKIPMGKGQRARYFSYELISTSADFDLETLEFVPIVVQRRV